MDVLGVDQSAAICRIGRPSSQPAVASMWSTTWLRKRTLGTAGRLLRGQRHGTEPSSPRVAPRREKAGLHELSSVSSMARIRGGFDESYPYPSAYESPYPETKAIGEQAVLARTARNY